MSNPRLPRKVRDVIDMDYLERLSDKEFAWMVAFISEYYYANFARSALHTTVLQRRELYRLNNGRQRDVWNQFDRVDVPEFVSEPEDDDK